MSALHPLFAAVLGEHTAQHAQLARALRKANARRFRDEPVTGFDAALPAAPIQSLDEATAESIAELAAEMGLIDGTYYVGYDIVREHLEAAIAALGKCGVRSDEDIEREAKENASEARGEAQRDDEGSAA